MDLHSMPSGMLLPHQCRGFPSTELDADATTAPHAASTRRAACRFHLPTNLIEETEIIHKMFKYTRTQVLATL
jgi:hypothetical protein